jgi:2Fe-2S ferredoxin
MPKLVVDANPAGASKEVDVPDGGSVMDIADEQWLPIPFSCRSASCGTCQCEVLDGASLIEPPGEDEAELLDVVGGPEGSRLACQMVLKGGSGNVRLRPV